MCYLCFHLQYQHDDRPLSIATFLLSMDARTPREQSQEQAGLEVAPSNDPVVCSLEYSYLQVCSDAPLATIIDYSDLEVASIQGSGNASLVKKPTPLLRICGVTKRAFWLTLALAIIILVGAVGGGVGGAFANQSQKDDKARPGISTLTSRTSSTDSSSGSPTSPPAAGPSSSVPSIRPSDELLADCFATFNGRFSIMGQYITPDEEVDHTSVSLKHNSKTENSY